MTKSTRTIALQGDIYLAKVYFTQVQGYKNRPVLILSNTESLQFYDGSKDQDYLIAPITSQDPRNDFDIYLDNWKNIGLSVASYVRVTKQTALPRTALLNKLGAVTPDQLKTIKEKLFAIY